MSRPLRNNVVGGWYHVTSRGHNRRHQQCGSLYQGRFKAVLVEGGGWLLRLSQGGRGHPLEADVKRQITPPFPERE
jgi:hypothetical protein